MSVAADPSLFRQEYEQELEAWLRRRFRTLCVIFWVIACAQLVWHGAWLVARFPDGWDARVPHLVWMGADVLILLTVGGYLFGRTQGLDTRDQLVQAASQMILVLGALSLAAEVLVHLLVPDVGGRMLGDLLLWHLTACLVLPWRPGESVRPMIPLLTAWALIVFLMEWRAGSMSRALLFPMLGWLVLLPGLGICAWRMSRHRRDFLKTMVGRHFITLRREMAEARTIHEGMFPKPYENERVRFEYAYQPMREMGGDFVHLHVDERGRVHFVLIDVTGHGLAAALTVNRLYGEIERIRAETPDARPEDVIRLLNRYIHLTMVRHSIFGTAIALMLDPEAGLLRWANAGHPPAFLRRGDRVDELAATTVVLGALEDHEFDPDPQVSDVGPGDVVLAYTDGTFEQRNRRGEEFGLDRLRELVRRRPAPGNWPDFLASAVARFSAGRSDDDILVTALTLRRSDVASSDAPAPAVSASASAST